MLKEVLRWILLAPWRWWTFHWESYKEEIEKEESKRRNTEEWLRKRKKQFFSSS